MESDVTMEKTCYLCKAPLEDVIDEHSANHEEHIIPQSIGGQLKVSGILCKTCGGEKFLGGKVDKPFADIFSLFTGQLEIKKDRSTSSPVLYGKLAVHSMGSIIDVCLKDGVLIHTRPQHAIDDEKKVAFIYANKITAKDYVKKVKAELTKQGKNPLDYTIKTVSDLSSLNEFIGTLELPFNVSNEAFNAGFAKIAFEFALMNEVNISHLEHLVDTDKRQFDLSKFFVFPYYPICVAEERLEYVRTDLDSNFMSHSLVLFSHRQVQKDKSETKQLYCFVELFGTFQYFVRLNDDYKGPNIEPITYAQRIMKEEPFDHDIDHLDYKDMSIYINDLKIPWESVKDKDHDEIRKIIDNKLRTQNKYVFDYASNIKGIVDQILLKIIFAKNVSMIEDIPKITGHFFKNVDTDDFHITFFRSRYIKDRGLHSIIPALITLYKKDKDKFNRYTFFKFNELVEFIRTNKKK